MTQEHIARCNALIPFAVKAIPSWDLLVHIPEEEWSYDAFCKPDSACSLVRWIVIEMVEGSQDATDENLVNMMIVLLGKGMEDIDYAALGLALRQEERNPR